MWPVSWTGFVLGQLSDACALFYAGGPSQLWSTSVMSSRGGGIWGRCSLWGQVFTTDVVGRAGWEGEGIVWWPLMSRSHDEGRLSWCPCESTFSLHCALTPCPPAIPDIMVSHARPASARKMLSPLASLTYLCLSVWWVPWWLSAQEPTWHSRRGRFDPCPRKMPWRKKWQPTPVFLPRRSREHRSLVGCRPWGPHELDTA